MGQTIFKETSQTGAKIQKQVKISPGSILALGQILVGIDPRFIFLQSHFLLHLFIFPRSFESFKTFWHPMNPWDLAFHFMLIIWEYFTDFSSVQASECMLTSSLGLPFALFSFFLASIFSCLTTVDLQNGLIEHKYHVMP